MLPEERPGYILPMLKNENFALASMLATILPTGADLGKASVRKENAYSTSFRQGGLLLTCVSRTA